MRKAFATLTVLLIACLQAARADISLSAAPADEYFGPTQQSVLEIRNRLNDYDQRDGQDMLDPSVAPSLDHLETAIVDWQHKYPRDPWLPATFAHLMREYWRAGQSSSERGVAALAVMRSAYPEAAETTATVSLIYGSNDVPVDTARDSEAPSYAQPYPNVAPGSEVAPAADIAPVPDAQPVPDSNVAAASNVAADTYEAPPSSDVVPQDDVPTPPPTR